MARKGPLPLHSDGEKEEESKDRASERKGWPRWKRRTPTAALVERKQVCHARTKKSSLPGEGEKLFNALTNIFVILLPDEVGHVLWELLDHDLVQVEVGAAKAVKEKEAEEITGVGDHMVAGGQTAGSPQHG